jgi:hypothetical protein
MKIKILWDVTPLSLVDSYQLFKEFSAFIFRGEDRLPPVVSQKHVERVGSSILIEADVLN